MCNSKKAYPVAPTAGRLTENGTNHYKSPEFSLNLTTTGQQRQLFCVSDLLGAGQPNAIPLRHLVSITGRSSRAIRKQIEVERRQGIPILSDNLSGYYLPADEIEQERFIRSMRHRAGEILKSAEAIEMGGRSNE